MTRHGFIGAALLLTLGVSGCADAAPLPRVITNTVELDRALEQAKGGERIVLAPGNYGISLANRQFTAPVTITSQSRDAIAQISRFMVKNVSNLTFERVAIGRPLNAGEPGYSRLADLIESRNILFDHVDFHGSKDGNPANDGWGLYILGGSKVTVRRSAFSELTRGAVSSRITGLKFEGNSFTTIASDGSNFAAVDDVEIVGNCFTGFSPQPGDHPDAIQFWTQGQTRGSSRVRIADNQLFQGDGEGFQGIFIGGEPGKRHSKFEIVNNLIYVQDQYHGIAVADADDVLIADNTVVSIPDHRPLWISVLRVGNAEIRGNITDRILNRESNAIRLADNTVLDESPGARGKLKDLRAGAAASAAGLTISGRGYQGAPHQCGAGTGARAD
ncbi:right-handed parallel beta-helix repeat-containing protein [Sphingomonas flavalba]|uniref:right-handed parallel beta-helix repeat-containing protein n=1 Tax=Sphingomonas flavalba TaxID=2559804 RepID=UPI00109E3431|nr:right-handed parallel beta-helix repeat-containing protein [Sphingomonas flavalba]